MFKGHFCIFTTGHEDGFTTKPKHGAKLSVNKDCLLRQLC